jgi:hypothetical protein
MVVRAQHVKGHILMKLARHLARGGHFARIFDLSSSVLSFIVDQLNEDLIAEAIILELQDPFGQIKLRAISVPYVTATSARCVDSTSAAHIDRRHSKFRIVKSPSTSVST